METITSGGDTYWFKKPFTSVNKYQQKLITKIEEHLHTKFTTLNTVNEKGSYHIQRDFVVEPIVSPQQEIYKHINDEIENMDCYPLDDKLTQNSWRKYCAFVRLHGKNIHSLLTFYLVQNDKLQYQVVIDTLCRNSQYVGGGATLMNYFINIMRQVLQDLNGEHHDNYDTVIYLVALPGATKFYEKFGFKKYSLLGKMARDTMYGGRSVYLMNREI